MQILLAANPVEHVLAHPLHLRIAGIEINNHMLMALIAAILMLLTFPVLFRKAYQDAPSGARNFFESILEFLRVEVFRPALKEHTDRFVPFLWTVFFFILYCNLLGAIPIAEIVTLFTRKPSHIGGTATGNINTTAALAICAFIFIHLNGIAQVAIDLMRGTYGHHGHHEEHTSNGSEHHEAAHDLDHMRGEALAADIPGDFRAMGNPTPHYGDDQFVAHHHHQPDHGDLHGRAGRGKGMSAPAAILLALPLYFWNFAPHPFKPEPGAPWTAWLADIPMWLMLLVLEMIGAVIKPFALMVRLFANMVAGHIVISVLVTLIISAPSILGQFLIGTPLAALGIGISMLELFVAFLQAYIFTFLTTLFMASAIAPEH